MPRRFELVVFDWDGTLIDSASAIVGANGFSHNTCLPEASRASTISRCRWLATTTLTTSMSSASATACHDVSARS